MPDFLTLAAFRERARAGTIGDARVRAPLTTAVKAGDAERTLEFTISTPAVDRMGDTIAVEGWDLGNYVKNPVVMWAHDYESLPVAKCTKLSIEGNALKATAEFTPAGMARFNDTVFEMYRQGFLSATSVGFVPIKWAWVDGNDRNGIDFLEQELVEFSCVPVPANPEALITGRSAGLDLEPVLDWARTLLRAAAPRTGKLAFKAPAVDPDECPMGDDCPMRAAKTEGAAAAAKAARAKAKARLDLARRRAA